MTQKRYTEIPKRQKCINKEEPYIGGAKDIIDDELGKPQSQINQEEIANLAAEVQRAQQAEGVLDGKVATEKQRAEGVEGGLNTRLQTVEALAEISVGGGDIGIGTAADFESDDPEDLAKVPTISAMLGGTNDGVYDISARHSGATYADLSAALGTNGANVPVGVRRGGMSIKFVQSSDNKYVQYFLTKSEWSASKADWEKMNLEEKVNQLSQQLIEVSGKKYTFESSSYNTIPFNVVLPIGTKIDKTLYPHVLYLVDTNNNDILIGASAGVFTINAEIVAFKPTTNDSGIIRVIGELDGYDEQISKINKQIINGFGVDVSFVNKSYSKVPFDITLPVGTIINNNGYAGYMYLYDKDGNEYGWNPASHTYTTTAEIVSFMPTTNDSGRLTTNSLFNELEEDVNDAVSDIGKIKNDLGLYHCNIWGGQVNFGTGQLYSLSYNNYHFSDPIPIDDNVKSVFCADSNVERYMFYSDMPIIGENTGIYLGYKEKYNTDPIPSGAKYAVVTFVERYVPSVQPFDVFVDKIAYNVNFSKKMEGKKLVTIGDSLTQSCVWQPKLMRYSGMQWSFNECYAGVGYVNLNDGTYTTENKSTDPDYRAARPTALYGTPLRPTSDDSIYMRSLDVKFYNPDIIFIYGGENDAIENWVTSGNTGTTPEEIVANETPYLGRIVNSNISAIAAYKGLIENLIADCPNVVIYIVNSMPVYCEIGKEVSGTVRFPDMASVRQWEKTNRYSKVEYMREIAKYYSLPLIDLWNKAGINDVNASQWYGETAADATQVHPNGDGYLRMADVMLQCL